jgi:ABC-2 type transport system permease protein
MSKLWVVIKREYLQVVKKKSFVIGIFLIPLLMAGFMLLPAWLAQRKSSSTEYLAVIDQSGSGLGQDFAESLAEYKLDDEVTPYYHVTNVFEIDVGDSLRFAAIRDSLREEVNEQNVKYFLVVKPEPQMSDTNLYLVTNSDNFRTLRRFERQLSNLISSIKLKETNINLPIDSVLSLTERIDLKLQDTKGEAIPFEIKYFAALIFVMIMFGMMIGYGALVMRSVIDEKNSRIMEVLMSSISPFQLMLGKVIGLGAATLTQVGVWLVVGGVIWFMGGALAMDFNPAIARMIFNPVIIVFFVLLLVTGYLMISTIYALIGSIVNSEKEAQGFLMPVNLSIILPVMIGIYVVQEPNSLVAVALSFIPPFAPTMMMMRLVFVAPTVVEYSFFSGILGQAILSYIVIVLSTLAIIWLTGKIFRVGILMYGKRPTLPELLKWIRY